jgi:hypothetical protein
MEAIRALSAEEIIIIFPNFTIQLISFEANGSSQIISDQFETCFTSQAM